jgi:hypothetical protein
MTNQWRKNEEMAVWGYDKKTKEFRQKKEAIKAPLAGFKLVTRVIVWSVFIGFYFFIFVLLVSGCSYIKKDNDEIKITDLPPIEYQEPIIDKINIVACIKMLPECNV